MQNNKTHFMWDIETLGSEADAVVVSLGIVKFNICTGDILTQKYLEFDVQEQLDGGRTVTADTLHWWLQQPIEARATVLDSTNPEYIKTSVITLLGFLNEWIAEHSDKGTDVCIWGNGPAFDNTIMKNLYTHSKIKFPFKYNADLCVRTIVDLCRDLGNFDPKGLPREGIHHNALDDAIWQAKVVTRAYMWMKS